MTWETERTSSIWHICNNDGTPLHPVYDHLHELKMELQALRIDASHHKTRVERLEADLDDACEEIGKTRQASMEAVGKIERRINGAIQWLALGAGALLLKLIGPKIGL
jgi:DNA repair ATPase RecN